MQKPGQKIGPGGLRLIHVCPRTAGAWFGGLRRARAPAEERYWSHGSIGLQPRIAPLLIQMATQCRSRQAGGSVAVALYDATNAFSRSRLDSLNEAANVMWRRPGAVHVEDHLRWHYFQLRGQELMEFVWSPALFNYGYAVAIDKWLQEREATVAGSGMFESDSFVPGDDQVCDIGLAVYADDIACAVFGRQQDYFAAGGESAESRVCLERGQDEGSVLFRGGWLV